MHGHLSPHLAELHRAALLADAASHRLASPARGRRTPRTARLAAAMAPPFAWRSRPSTDVGPCDAGLAACCAA